MRKNKYRRKQKCLHRRFVHTQNPFFFLLLILHVSLRISSDSEGPLNVYYINTVWLSGQLSSHLSGARLVCFCICEAIPLLMAFVFPTEIQAFRFPLGSPLLSIKMKRFEKGPVTVARDHFSIFLQSDPNNTDADTLTPVAEDRAGSD